MALLWTDHSKKQYHLFIKLFLVYFKFFSIFKFYLGPDFFYSHFYESGLVFPPFLTYRFEIIDIFFKKMRFKTYADISNVFIPRKE